jgi:hypothetical protein
VYCIRGSFGKQTIFFFTLALLCFHGKILQKIKKHGTAIKKHGFAMKKDNPMWDLLIVIGFLVLWVVLNRFVLPRFGINT